MSELFDGLQIDEFEKMVETFIDQEDPDAMSPGDVCCQFIRTGLYDYGRSP